LVTVEAVQSPGLADELGGAGGAGAGGGALGAASFARTEEDLAAALVLMELAAALGIFFFTIARSERIREIVVAARAPVTNTRRARTTKKMNGGE
jgi:hypothetical protein